MFHHEYFKSTNEFQQKMTAWLHEKKIPENSRFYRMVEALFDIQNSQHNGINENNDVRKTELMLEFYEWYQANEKRIKTARDPIWLYILKGLGKIFTLWLASSQLKSHGKKFNEKICGEVIASMEDGIREILGKHNDLTPMQQLEMNYILAELEYGHHSRNKMMAFFDSNGLDFNLGDEIADNNECFNANYYDFTLAAARDLIRKENYKLIQRDGQCYLKGITGGTICEYAIKNEYKGKFVLYEKIFVEAFASLSRRTQKDIFKLLEKAAAVPRNPGGTEPNKPDGKRALKYEEEMKKFAIRYGCFQNEKGIVAEVSEHDLNTLAFLMGFSREDLKDQLKQIIDGDTCISVAYTNGFRGLERFHPKQNHKTERAIKAPAVNLAM